MAHDLDKCVRENPAGALLSLKVQPRASKNTLAGLYGNELKIKVMAPPVDAAANEALICLLAKNLACSRKFIEIVHGHKSRHKLVMIHGKSADDIISKLEQNLNNPLP
jgi:uncharacterized protein